MLPFSIIVEITKPNVGEKEEQLRLRYIVYVCEVVQSLWKKKNPRNFIYNPAILPLSVYQEN